jgi:hypothetical protein
VDWDPTSQLDSITGEEVDLTSRELGYHREHLHFLELICKGINGRDATNLRSDFQDFSDSCPRIVKDEIRDELQEVGSFIGLLEINQGSLIYVPKIQPIVVPNLNSWCSGRPHKANSKGTRIPIQDYIEAI